MTTQVGQESNPSEDITDRIRLLGLGEAGDTSKVTPLRLNTMQEMLFLEAMMRGEGLDRSQFAQNPWGFPFMPFPASNGRLNGVYPILVPEGTPITIGQHPIYWIDENLTRPTEDEQRDPSRWCVRMFYLIMGFGLWNDRNQWISAPCMKLEVQSIGSVEYENYLQGFESSLENVRYTVDDLIVPLEVIEREASRAIHRCQQIQRDSWTSYRTEQLTAYEYSLRLLTDLDYTPWHNYSDELAEICAQIATASEERQSLSEYVDPLFGVVSEIVKFFDRLETNNVILSAISLKSHAANVNEYNRISAGIAQFRSNIKESGYANQLQEAANKMINDATEDSGPEHFTKIYQKAENLYLNIERRLKLQTVNYARVLSDQEPFATYTEMEIIESGDENIGLDNLPSLSALSSKY